MQDEHICFNYLCGKLSQTKLKQFYLQVCKIMDYNDETIVSKSAILAMYGVFNSKPLSIEDLRAIKSPKNLHCSCKLLVQDSQFRKYSVAQNACLLCKHSTDYKNEHISKEFIILRYLMSAPLDCHTIDFPPSLLFSSLTRLCDDYSNGQQPIMPLNKEIFTSLADFGQIINDQNLDKFVDHVCKSKNTLKQIGDMEPAVVHNIIYKHIFAIFKNDLISHDRFIYYLDGFCQKPFSSPIMNTVTETLICTTENDKEEEKLIVQSMQEDTLTSYTFCEDNRAIETANKEDKLLETVESKLIDLHSPNVIDGDSVLESIHTSIKDNTNISKEFTAYYDMADFEQSFKDAITTVTHKNVFRFFKAFMNSEYVSVEPVVRNSYLGLLFYCDRKNHFFFCDAELCGGDMLSSYFSFEKPKILSFHPLEVMAILHSIGGCVHYITALDILYGLTHSNKIDTVPKMTSSTLSNPDTDYFSCKSSMIVYGTVFKVLAKQAECQNTIWEDYKNTYQVYMLLSKSLFLKSLSYKLPIGFVQNSFLDFTFNYEWEMSWQQPGTIFKIEIPELDCYDGLLPNSFITQLCIAACLNFPHSYSKKTTLLSVTDNFIYLFYSGDVNSSRRYYDLLLMAMQRLYKEYYSKPLHNQIYCKYYLD